MHHRDFRIGGTFWCSDRQWRCTDIATRTIVTIRIDSVAVGSTDPTQRRTLSHAEAEVEDFSTGHPTESPRWYSTNTTRRDALWGWIPVPSGPCQRYAVR